MPSWESMFQRWKKIHKEKERNHNFNLYLNFVIFIEKLFKNRKFWLLPSQVVTVLDILNRMVTWNA